MLYCLDSLTHSLSSRYACTCGISCFSGCVACLCARSLPVYYHVQLLALIKMQHDPCKGHGYDNGANTLVSTVCIACRRAHASRDAYPGRMTGHSIGNIKCGTWYTV